MKKSLLCVASFLLLAQAYATNIPTKNIKIENLATSSVKKISMKVENCTDWSQFFKISNNHPDANQFLVFLQSENFDVNSTMLPITEIHEKESEVFSNSFSTMNKAIYTGVVHLAIYGDEPKVEAMCGLTFACQQNNVGGYMVSIETNGARCSLAGAGTQDDPYVVEVNTL
jgi:hypothetical protein